MSTEFLTSLAMKRRARKTLARYALVLLVWPVLAVAGEVQPMDVIRGASEKVLLQLNVETGIRNDPARLIPVIQELAARNTAAAGQIATSQTTAASYVE